MSNIFDVKIGESTSARDAERGEDKRVQVRESRGKFYVQENTVGESGKQLNKQTLGRSRRDPDKAIERARSRVDDAIEGISPVEFERQIPTGKFAPDGTRPDASVPPDRGPEGRFVSGQRKPVDSIGRREIDGLFSQFDRPPEAPFRDGPPQLDDAITEKPDAPPTTAQGTALTPQPPGKAAREAERAAISSRDVSLSLGEAFDGVGTMGRDNRGTGDAPVTDRFGRYDKDPQEEQQELDAIAAESGTMGAQDRLVEAFNDPSTNIGLREVGEGITSEDQAQDVLSKFVNGD